MYSEQYLSNLSKMHRILTRSNLELKKQRKYEQELEELRMKMILAERRVDQQKAFMNNLQPVLKGVEKTVLADRNILLKLKNCCNRLGTHVLGPKYK